MSPVESVLQYHESVSQGRELVYVVHILPRTTHEPAERGQREGEGESTYVEFMQLSVKRNGE